MTINIEKNLFFVKTLVWCALFLMLFPAIGSGPAEDPLIYLKEVDISTLDPGATTDTYSSEVISNIYEGLVRFRKDGPGVEPELAVSWETDSTGKKWIFRLRKGVRFHNGEEFNSKAVEVNFNTRIMNKKKYENWNRLNSHIASIGAVDDHTIEIMLDKPFVPFLSSLASPKSKLVAPSAYSSGSFRPAGTGPFKFSEREPGKYLSLVRNEDYWGGPVRLKKIIFKVVTDVAWRIIQLKTGNASLMMVQSSREYEEIRGRRDIGILSVPSVSVHYLAFNTAKGIFQNRNARLAFAHILNKGPLIRSIFQDFANNSTTPIPPHIFGFNPEIKDRDFDIVKARNLLKLAGISDGTRVSLYYSGNSKILEEIAGVIKKFADKIGVHVFKVPLSFPDLRKAVNERRHDMFMMGWSADIPDPDVFLYGTFADRDSLFNRAAYSDPELTRLLDKARRTVDTSEREKMYFRAQEIIFRDCPWVPLFNLKDLLAYKKNIKGLSINQLSHVIFRDAYMEEN